MTQNLDLFGNPLPEEPPRATMPPLAINTEHEELFRAGRLALSRPFTIIKESKTLTWIIND